MKNKLNYGKVKTLKRKVRKEFKGFILMPKFKDSVLRLIVLIERNEVNRIPVKWMERDYSATQYLSGTVDFLQVNFEYKRVPLAKEQVYFAYNNLQFINPLSNELCEDYDNISMNVTIAGNFKRETK